MDETAPLLAPPLRASRRGVVSMLAVGVVGFTAIVGVQRWTPPPYTPAVATGVKGFQDFAEKLNAGGAQVLQLELFTKHFAADIKVTNEALPAPQVVEGVHALMATDKGFWGLSPDMSFKNMEFAQIAGDKFWAQWVFSGHCITNGAALAFTTSGVVTVETKAFVPIKEPFKTASDPAPVGAKTTTYDASSCHTACGTSAFFGLKDGRCYCMNSVYELGVPDMDLYDNRAAGKIKAVDEIADFGNIYTTCKIPNPAGRS